MYSRLFRGNTRFYGVKSVNIVYNICIVYDVPSIGFQIFFVLAFKIVVDSWKFTMLLQCVLWDDWQIFMISGSNQQLYQQFEYTLLNPDCHSWWISKMQSGRQDTLEEWYAIKFNKCIVWCQCRNCTHNYSRGTETPEDLREVCPKGAQRRSERKMLS